ncbi:hypothetical protein CLD22_19115 [Rubrivivax gelatinosus]|nr:hypothetical protein [Rubrivivax gelatinosus]
MDDSTVPPATGGAAPERPARQGWLDALQSVLRELPGLVGDRVELFVLELNRAGRALAQIVALVVAAAVLGVTGWLALWAGITGALIDAGLYWGWALIAVLAANLLAAWLAVRRIRSLLPLLHLPATRRHLTTLSSPAAPAARGASNPNPDEPARAAA